jgi:OFA family oxalate/formate antiporter-like MFS transporter
VTIRRKPYYGWWVLLSASSVVAIGFGLSSYAQPVFYPELVKAFRWPRASVALGGSLKTLLVGVIAPLNGWIIDRKGVKGMFLAGLVTLGIFYALLSGIHSLWQYYLVSLFLGLGGSWTHLFPAHLLIAKWFVKKRGLAMGILTTIAGIGASLIPILSATLIKSVGWREALLSFPIILIAPFLAVAFLVRNQPQDMGLHPDGALAPAAASPHAPATAKSASSDPAGDLSFFKTAAFWMLSGMLFFSAWADFSVWQHVVLFLRDAAYSPIAAASVFSLFPAASTFSRFFIGPLCDKVSAAYVMMANLVLMAFAFASLIATHSPAMLYLSMICFGLGHGGTITCRPLLVFEHYGAAGVGKLYGMVMAVFTSGACIGPAVGGYIFDSTRSYNLSFVLSLVLICMAIALALLFNHTVSKMELRSEPEAAYPTVA